MNNLNIMIVGVGGQGTLLASRILGRVAQLCDKDVKVSEVHGMSQRGGSVVTYVKMGSRVFSPIIEKGTADIIMAFEELEAYRYIEYLKPDGKYLINAQEINPMPVITGAASYPVDILAKLKQKECEIISVDAFNIAKKCGNIKAVNVVLIGLLAKNTDITKELWLQALEQVVPSKVLEVNLKAFEAGYNY